MAAPTLTRQQADNAVAQPAAVYDAHAADILLPLPQMDADPVRRALDDAVASALGLDGGRRRRPSGGTWPWSRR